MTAVLENAWGRWNRSFRQIVENVQNINLMQKGFLHAFLLIIFACVA